MLEFSKCLPFPVCFYFKTYFLIRQIIYVCGRSVASTIRAPQRYRWCHTLAEMLRVLHTISFQVLTKLKRNWPWEICLHFHGLQKIISFKLSILLPHFNSCLALIILLFVCFSFSFSMSGRGHGKGRGRGGGHGSGRPTSSKPGPVPSKLQKGRKLNEWKTENMKNALAEFDRDAGNYSTSSASMIFFWFSGLVSKCVSKSFFLGFFNLSSFNISKRLQNLTFLATSSSSSQ